jgi:hypothetical protein
MGHDVLLQHDRRVRGVLLAVTGHGARTSRALLVVVLLAVTGMVSCGGGGGGDEARTLSIVSANMANAADVEGRDWKERVDRFAAAIDRTGVVPDIISMTESAGLWHCLVTPFRTAEDYDLVDRLISNLRRDLGVTYRVAYMVGAAGAIKNPAGTPFCFYYSGDTLLYNPERLRNLTPDDVAARAKESHDGALVGFQIRRSLPLCKRGTTLEPLEQLIDGPPQRERCNLDTPSGPAYIQLDLNRGGDHTLVASLARFGRVDVPDSSFDVVTTHPMAGEEQDHAETINSFIAGLTGPPYRESNPYYPVLVVGDYNSLVEEEWPTGTTKVFRTPADVMAVSVGSGVGLDPAHDLAFDLGMTLPTAEPCRGERPVEGSFSDHCGLLVRFTER